MSKTFKEQYHDCRQNNNIGIAEGPELSELLLCDLTKKNDKFLKLKSSLCLKFGGFCYSDNENCKKIRNSN